MAVEDLRRRYAIHQPHNWTPTLASFKAPHEADLGVGVQLVVEGSDADGFFGPFRDALISTPTLLAEYNQLKLRLGGLDCEQYTEGGEAPRPDCCSVAKIAPRLQSPGVSCGTTGREQRAPSGERRSPSAPCRAAC